MFKIISAWLVHAYTALGLIAAALGVVLIVSGGEENFRLVFLLLFFAFAIDSTDGWLARRLRVKEVIPSFDGRRLDDIVDFNTYTTIPLLLIWRIDLLPGHLGWLLLLPLLASAYGFSQTNAKTEDGFFLGFPSYWNVVALYFFLLQPKPWLAVTTIVLLSILTFVPTKYLHPTMPGPLSKLTNILGLFFALLVLAILVGILEVYPWTLLSLSYPAYYLVASWTISIVQSRRGINPFAS